MKFARPRFTIRWVMIAFTLLGVAFYFLFVRPTVLADQFVRDIQRGDFAQAESLLSDPTKNRFGKRSKLATSTTVASVYPRDWRDIWHFRRTIEVSSFFPNDRIGIGTSEQVIATSLPPATLQMRGSAAFEAGPFGIRLIRNDIRRIDLTDRY